MDRRGRTVAVLRRAARADGAEFDLGPGDVLLAEDTTGGGHRWELTGDEPWRRAYVELATD